MNLARRLTVIFTASTILLMTAAYAAWNDGRPGFSIFLIAVGLFVGSGISLNLFAGRAA